MVHLVLALSFYDHIISDFQVIICLVGHGDVVGRGERGEEHVPKRCSINYFTHILLC